MKKTLVLLIVLAIVFGGFPLLKVLFEKSGEAPLPRADQYEWLRFEDEAKSFSIRMPGKPTVTREKLLNGVKVQLRHPQLNAEFFVFHHDVPNPPEGDSKMLLEAIASSVAKQNKSKLISTSTITMSAHPGLAIELQDDKVPGVKTQVARMFLVNGRLYYAAMVSTKRNVSSDIATFYLDSFRISAKRTHHVGEKK
jgi:hypothetical protein